jgi:BMFP domain-containing protein YqiC
MAIFHSEDPEDFDKLRMVFGPEQIDQQIRQAIQSCWMMLPTEKKTVDDVERQIRRLVDRALRDLREDFDAFGLSGPCK